MSDELIPIDPQHPERPQYFRPVDALPHFNGATCLVVIDVLGVGTAVGFDWVTKHRLNPGLPPPTDHDIADATVAKIISEAAKCPAGSAVKLQLMYHSDPKHVWGLDPGGKVIDRPWQIQVSILEALKQIAKSGKPPIAKLYLTGCTSDNDRDLVNEAFKIPGLTHVVTADTTIELIPGAITGATWPAMLPQPVRVSVWIKEGDKQVRLTPKTPISAHDKFDIPTNSVKDRKCPTVETLSGDTHFTVGYWNSEAEAIAGGNALLPNASKTEAEKAFRSYQCPCPSCSRKVLGVVSFAGSTVTPDLSWLASAIYWRKSYKATVYCHWSVPVACE